MRLSEYERKVLLDSPIYKKYATLGFSSVTLATILTDLNAIAKCSIDNLPLIKFLTQLAKARGWSQEIDYMSSIDTDTGNIYSQNNIQSKVLKSYVGNYAQASPLYAGDEVLADKTITLSSGVLANFEAVSATAAKQTSLLWVILNADTVPGTAYTLLFHDDTDGNKALLTITPGDLGKKFWLYYVVSSDNEPIDVDVAGGAGAEVLSLTTCSSNTIT